MDYINLINSTHEDTHKGMEVKATEKGKMLVRQIFTTELVSTIHKDIQFFKMGVKFGQAQHHRS